LVTKEENMSFETISLLLSWVELGVLLAILLRLGRTFELIAGTQRELRRAIHHLGEQRAPLGAAGALTDLGAELPSRSLMDPDEVEFGIDNGDFGPSFAVK
jgi:hypothetical protein